MVRRLGIMVAGAGLGALAAAQPVLAHHAMGGELPRTWWHGLLSGLGHPVIGIDHLAFVLGVGLLAYLAGRMVLLPVLLVAGTAVGCLVHVGGYELPGAELGIALSVAAAAVLVVAHARVAPGVLTALVALAGGLHGYAYGGSIVGAEPAPLGAYLVGFAVIQGLIAIGTALALRALIGRDCVGEARAMQVAGAGLGAVAAVALANVALAG